VANQRALRLPPREDSQAAPSYRAGVLSAAPPFTHPSNPPPPCTALGLQRSPASAFSQTCSFCIFFSHHTLPACVILSAVHALLGCRVWPSELSWPPAYDRLYATTAMRLLLPHQSAHPSPPERGIRDAQCCHGASTCGVCPGLYPLCSVSSRVCPALKMDAWPALPPGPLTSTKTPEGTARILSPLPSSLSSFYKLPLRHLEQSSRSQSGRSIFEYFDKPESCLNWSAILSHIIKNLAKAILSQYPDQLFLISNILTKGYPEPHFSFKSRSLHLSLFR
jgi:hypothetical protein